MTKTIYHDTDSIEDEDAVISVIADKLGILRGNIKI